jgi:hypothetical protein
MAVLVDAARYRRRHRTVLLHDGELRGATAVRAPGCWPVGFATAVDCVPACPVAGELGPLHASGQPPRQARWSAAKRLGSDGGLGLLARLPIPGKKINDFVGRVIWKAGEHVGEPSLGIDVVHLAGLCRPPNYAERVRYGASLSRWHRRSRARQPHSIRHSLVVQSASRKASRRSFG